jgi:hypothetical protein
MGCAITETHFGVIINGNRSTNALIISKERLPDPIIIEARNSITCTPDLRRISPTSSRLRMCGESSSPLSANPPR